MNQNNFAFNWIRGICAAIVVFGHTRYYLTENYSISTTYSSWQKVLLLPSAFAMEAVAVFFVLSGFLVGGQTYLRVKNRNFSSRVFIVDRLTRLWIVLIPGLVFSIFSYHETRSNLTSSTPGVLEFSCNVVFLMPTRCESFAGNISLWSLGYEFYFYILFASLVFATNRDSKIHARVIGAAVAGFTLFLFGYQLVYFFPAWLLGFFTHSFVGKSRYAILRAILFCHWSLHVLLLILVGIITSIFNFEESTTTLMCSIPAALLINRLKSVTGRSATNVFYKYLDKLGDSSFSIYVFHFPVLILLAETSETWLIGYGVLKVYVLGSITLLLSHAFYPLFEAHTTLARRLVYSWLSISKR